MYFAYRTSAVTTVGTTVMWGYFCWKALHICLNSGSRVASQGCQTSSVTGAALLAGGWPDCPGAQAASAAAAPPAACISTARRNRPCLVFVATRFISVSFCRQNDGGAAGG